MKNAILILSLLGFVIPGLAGTSVAGDQYPAAKPVWQSLSGSFARSGLSEYSGPELGCVKWKFETERAVSASVTVDADGRVYVPCEDGRLYTLDANGSLLWSYDANSPLLSAATLGHDGTVYVGSRDGRLHAIDVDGNLRWTHYTDGPIYSSPAVSAEGNIYVCSQDGTVYALGPDSSELWSFETKGPGEVPTGSIFASPAIGIDGTVYIGGLYDPNLYALDPNDGSIRWVCHFESEGWPFVSPVIAGDGTIYQTLLYDPNLYAIDPQDGAIIWSTDLADPCSGWFDDYYADEHGYADGWSEPVLGPDGTIYASFDDPHLRAVDPNGTIKWIAPLGDTSGLTLSVGSDGLIYAASDDGKLHVIDAKGWEIASFESDGWLNLPVISTDGIVLVTDAKDDSFLITDANNAVWAIGSDGCGGQIFDMHWMEDLNADGVVDFVDFTLFTADWLNCTDRQWPCGYIGMGDEIHLFGDMDGDQYVFFSDLKAIADVWLGADRADRAARSPGSSGPPSGWPKAPPKGRACFPAEVPVWVNGRVEQISKVAAEQIMGVPDCHAALLCSGTIKKIEEHQGVFECYHMLLETGDSIAVADSHYFLSDSGQWLAVQDLRAGSKLQSIRGLVGIRAVVKGATPLVGKVYNLKIRGADRYFVGKDGVIARDW